VFYVLRRGCLGNAIVVPRLLSLRLRHHPVSANIVLPLVRDPVVECTSCIHVVDSMESYAAPTCKDPAAVE